MPRIADPLELLTTQHADLDRLLDRLAAAAADDRDVVFAELADKWIVHLAAEQKLLYPACAQQLAPETLHELLAEHREIKAIIADLLWFGLGDAELAPRLAKLRTLLAGHAMWQEDQLFATIAQTLERPVLTELGAQLQAWSEGVPSILRAA